MFESVIQQVRKIQLIRLLTIFSILVLPAGCGFTPVYSSQGSSNDLVRQLAAIEVQAVKIGPKQEDVLMQQARMLTEDALNPKRLGIKPRKALKLDFNISEGAAAIQRDKEITRFNVTISAYYSLIQNDSEVIKTGKIIREGSFDVVDSDYATYVSRKDTIKRILAEIVEDLRLQLIVHLKRKV